MSYELSDKIYEYVKGKPIFDKELFYHYTSINSFFHIIMNQSIWFSSLAFMNDTNEGINIIDSVKCSNKNREQLKEMYLSTITEALHRYYSFSATSLEDDISQWRAYTPLGQGICFGFEDGFIKHENANHIECIYDDDEKSKAIMNLIPKKEFNNIFKTNNYSISDALKLNSSLLEIAPKFKHQSFKPENESRWLIKAVYSIGLTEFPNDEEIQFRTNDKLGLIPYIHCNIDLSKIRKIIIGPQVPKENIESLHRFMNKYRGTSSDIKPCRIQVSNVSLR